MLGVRRHQLDDFFQQFRNRHGAVLRGECALHPVTLRPPFVLDRERAPHRVDVGVLCGIPVEVADDGAIECGKR